MALQAKIDAGAAHSWSIEVHEDPAAVADTWRAFERQAAGTPYDSYAWSEAWLRTEGRSGSYTPTIVIGRNEAREVLFLLPLAIRRHMGCSILEWLSSDHGNYACGLFDGNSFQDPAAPRGEKLLQAVLAELPQVDAIHLDNQLTEIAGMANPLADLPGVSAASAGYALPLDGDIDQHYQERFSKRYRNRLRRDTRRLAEHDDLCFTEVIDTQGKLAAVDFIIEQKRRWLERRGIDDFLATEECREFHRELVRMPASDGAPRACIHKLSVGKSTLAASLDLVFQNRLFGLIAATAEGPLQRYGPGKILLKLTVEHLKKRGISAMDFGAGEEDNKLRWCTEKLERRHAILPVSTPGHVYAGALKAALLAKQHVKQSPTLWRLATQIRRFKARPVSSSG